jgi:hypothetical protein
MKLCCLVLFTFLSISIFGQQPEKQIERLDDAIQLIGRQIENDIGQGSAVAVVNFDSSSEAFSNYVIEELNSLFLKNRKLVVVEQQRLDLVRQNEQYQFSGYVSDETMVRIGHNIGAQFIISGYLIDLGTRYSFGIFAINMEEATRVSSSSLYLSGYDDQVNFLLTGRTIRPSEKIIPTRLTVETSKAGFMQSASLMIGNSLINRIPRNSRIAILIYGDTVQMDYWKNELGFILSQSNRFRIIDHEIVDAFLITEGSGGSPVIYQSMVLDEEGFFKVSYNGYDVSDLLKIGTSLGASVVVQCKFTEINYENFINNQNASELTFQIQAFSINTSQVISNSNAYWCWPENGTAYIE